MSAEGQLGPANPGQPKGTRAKKEEPREHAGTDPRASVVLPENETEQGLGLVALDESSLSFGVNPAGTSSTREMTNDDASAHIT